MFYVTVMDNTDNYNNKEIYNKDNIVRVHLVHLVTERFVAANTQTKLTDLGCVHL